MPELEAAMNEVLTEKWGELRGLKVVSIAMSNISLPEEDQEMIKQAQKNAMFRDPTMAAATLVGAQADAMKAAASNTNGAMAGFMGMGMAQGAGGMNAQSLFAMGQQQQQAQQQAAQAQQAPAPAANTWKCPECGASASGKFCPECGSQKPEPKSAGAWKCPNCGASATGKFCPECGEKKPAEVPADAWKCPECGTTVNGKFCPECGTKRPSKRIYRCDKCGWTPTDPANPPKFCPECGDVFNDDDAQ